MRTSLVCALAAAIGLVAIGDVSAQTQYVASPAAFSGVTFLAVDSVDAPMEPTTRLTLVLTFEPQDAAAPAPQQRPMVFEYSDGYRLRAKIHWYASLATLPLFAIEGVVGQSLYRNPTQGKKDAHLAVAGAIAGLFAVNAGTGIWNLIEARRDPNQRPKRIVHSILMLAAAAGFAATAASGPENEGDENGQGTTEGSPSLHRAVAFTSIGLAAASYLIMLFGR